MDLFGLFKTKEEKKKEAQKLTRLSVEGNRKSENVSMLAEKIKLLCGKCLTLIEIDDFEQNVKCSHCASNRRLGSR